MPFTLAHPALVVPLRRRFPSLLPLDALVVGAVVPDSSYCLKLESLESLSHSFKGVLLYSLPVGLVMLAAFRLSRRWVVKMLPERQRMLFMPLCRGNTGEWGQLIFALILGSLTHVIWDSFTHKHGYVVEALPLLRYSLASYHWHELTVCILLWYLSSFGGVVYLV